ncbi:hypothetical protein DSOL_4899 [Desulfosporosinus metallidurans]|uniref:Uncharacterized protein n=1 Tax=Desulfosporosinus metallidurans TaxID=1888891 RepID=A0A1Q8QGZ2_9FIRM|nr:hypothetical protein DSOL_4899 [Desulfosporosinus metallidurans]
MHALKADGGVFNGDNYGIRVRANASEIVMNAIIKVSQN